MLREHEALLAFARARFFSADAALQLEEISEGNINHVYRVSDTQSDRSVILKQALEVSRISPDIRLHPNRGRREAAYYAAFAALLPAALPVVYAYDETQHLILMQDLRDCPVLRKAMLAGQTSESLGEKLGAFVAQSTAETSDFCLTHEKKKQMQADFSNPELCALTEKLVFTDPFLGAKDNGVCAENEAFLEKNLYQNPALHTRAAAMKFRFMNAPQALIHGDLHFGSVFLKADGTPVIFDPEFCFFGPIGFDLGNLLAHFIMELLFVRRSGGDASFAAWLKVQMGSMLHAFERRFRSAVAEKGADALLCKTEFINSFAASVFADTAAYAGVECLRRTVGIAKIPEFDLLGQAQRPQFERDVMHTGILLLEQKNEISDANALLRLLETTILD